MGDLRTDARCGVTLVVTVHSHTLLAPGAYPCTRPDGHTGHHTAVIDWWTAEQYAAKDRAATGHRGA